MKYNELTEVIYTNVDGEEIPTYIKTIDEAEQKYILDYDLEKVGENQVELNTWSNFYISLSNLSTKKNKEYSRDYLIDRIVNVLNRNIEDEDITTIRYMEMINIRIRSAEHFIKQGETKTIAKLNKLIQLINSRITTKHFNESISIELLLPIARYALKPILI
jgi:hypothetical protein